MKKTLLTSLLVVCLSGCSAHSNQINCQKIDIETKDGHYVVSGEHKERFDYVYEYLGPDFKPLYLDGVYMCRVVQGLGHDTGPYPIKVYETEGSKDYVEYIYNRTVGPIWSVHSYYLNMKTRTVEYFSENTFVKFAWPETEDDDFDNFATMTATSLEAIQ